jgi:flagellar biosynthesis protein FliP
MMRAIALLILAISALRAVEAPPLVTAPSSETESTAASAADSSASSASTASNENGTFSLTLPSGQGKSGTSAAVTLLLVITALSIAPAFLMMMTSFTRIIIVLGFVRRALGTQTLPPNQVMLGLALFLTLFVMAPTVGKLNNEALQPYMSDKIDQGEALNRAKNISREFLIKHTRKNDLALFIKLAGEERPRTVDDVSYTSLVPAFITSELKTSFQMGFIIFLPFLVIDLVISAVLMALGMMMLPPVVVSLPFKILLFVLVDGWVLLMQGLVASYA